MKNKKNSGIIICGYPGIGKSTAASNKMNIEGEDKEFVLGGNELLEYNVCDKAVVLVDVNNIENIDIAKQENRFLIYDDNREEVIKTFCSNNLK